MVYDRNLFNRIHVFRNRFHAGKLLSELLTSNLNHRGFVVLAIPAGGVPVTYEISKELGLELKVILVSKILFPWTTEAGFGAISNEGVVEINEEAVRYFALKEDVVRKQIDECREKIERRKELISSISSKFFEYDGDKAIIVDDGLASGFTMLAALKTARKFFEKTYVAVPTASLRAVKLIQGYCDGIFCVNLRDQYPYAVADAYIHWHDVTEYEMLELLKLYLEKK